MRRSSSHEFEIRYTLIRSPSCTIIRARSRRSMDRMPPSEGGDVGSIPTESTFEFSTELDRVLAKMCESAVLATEST